MKKYLIIFFGCLILGGCSKVSHLDQLLTLKDLADEQATLNEYIDQQDRNFDLMLKEFEAGTLDRYSNKQKILRTFGKPVFTRDVIEDEEALESWLYRYATQYFGVEKIYLYFDSKGNFVKSKYVKGKNGKSGQETAPKDEREEI